MPPPRALYVLRSNKFYEESDLPALGLISRSQSWLMVIFWYIIFIFFAVVCVYSLLQQYKEFRESPTQTEVKNVRAQQLNVPNISLCKLTLNIFDVISYNFYVSPVGQVSHRTFYGCQIIKAKSMHPIGCITLLNMLI
jgi:hypothetical protein